MAKVRADELIELQLVVTKIEYQGKKFNAYKTFQKNGKKIDVKFIKEVKNAPDVDSVIVVKLGNINLDKSRKYPCLWVRGIEEVKELPNLQNDPKRMEEVAELFNFDDDLPF